MARQSPLFPVQPAASAPAAPGFGAFKPSISTEHSTESTHSTAQVFEVDNDTEEVEEGGNTATAAAADTGLDAAGKKSSSSSGVRSSRWMNSEAICLIQLKGVQMAEIDNNEDKRERAITSRQKWEMIQVEMIKRGIKRWSWLQCKQKWNNLVSSYKDIKQYDNSTGCANYFLMDAPSRTKQGLQPLAKDVFDELEDLLADNPNVEPVVVLDSSAPKTQAQAEKPAQAQAIPTMSKGGGATGARRKAATIDVEFAGDFEAAREEAAEVMKEDRLPGDRVAGSSRKAKKVKKSAGETMVDVLREGNTALAEMAVKEEEARDRRHNQRLELERDLAREQYRLEERRLDMEAAAARDFTSILAAFVAKMPGAGSGSGQQ